MASAAPSPEDYLDFLSSLTLEGITLVSVDATSTTSSIVPEQSANRTECRVSDPIVNDAPDSFWTINFFVETNVRVLPLNSSSDGGDAEEFGSVRTTHACILTAKTEPDAGCLEVFGSGNVMHLVYPYVREFVADIVRRFGWPTLALPMLVSSGGAGSREGKGVTQDDDGE